MMIVPSGKYLDRRMLARRARQSTWTDYCMLCRHRLVQHHPVEKVCPDVAEQSPFKRSFFGIGLVVPSPLVLYEV